MAKQFFLEAKRQPAIRDRRSFCIYPRLAEEGCSRSPALLQRAKEYFNPEGFFGHPVLVFSNPGDKDYVRVFPMTSYGNKSAEEKWSGMHNPQEKAERLDQLPQIEHPGIPASGHSALLRLGPGQKLQKRSYVCLTNGGYNVETKLLTHYGREDTPSLDQNSIAALERLARKYDQH
ncbi:uncharacterized protein BKA78DRAFT_300419 [Phyllosticta capitalensis]|uniref:uncharacterized protein n=1 Tax=Phyllosticta capitalensis TaxID=121624 RepID=UPI003130EB87